MSNDSDNRDDDDDDDISSTKISSSPYVLTPPIWNCLVDAVNCFVALHNEKLKLAQSLKSAGSKIERKAVYEQLGLIDMMLGDVVRGVNVGFSASNHSYVFQIQMTNAMIKGLTGDTSGPGFPFPSTKH